MTAQTQNITHLSENFVSYFDNLATKNMSYFDSVQGIKESMKQFHLFVKGFPVSLAL